MLFSFENLFSKMYHMEKKAISKERKYNFVGNSLMINFSREREFYRNYSSFSSSDSSSCSPLEGERPRQTSFINKHPRLDLFLFLMNALPPCTKRTLGIF